MKKTSIIFIFLSILFILLFVLLVIGKLYIGWKAIDIDGVGSFKVPDDWFYTEEDNLIYFSDKPIDESDCKVYLLEPIKLYDKGNHYITNELFGTALYIDNIKGKILSNNVYYGLNQYEYNGKKIERFYIKFITNNTGYDHYLTLIAWDDLVDEDIIKKIAESYVIED